MPLLVRATDAAPGSPLARLRSKMQRAVVIDREHAPSSQIRAVVLLHTTSVESRLILFPASTAGECPMIMTVLQVGTPEFADPVTLIRHSVDRVWRDSALLQLPNDFCGDPLAAQVLRRALSERGPLQTAAHYRVSAKSTDVRMAGRVSTRTRRMSLKMPEIFDWVRYLRFVAGLGLGVTQEQRAAELGSNLRSMRRVRARLAHWLPNEPRRTEPADVVRALLTRLAPPPGARRGVAQA